jgi:hypothetical protein
MFSTLKGFLRKACLLVETEKQLNLLLSVRFAYTTSVVLAVVLAVAQTAETI